MSVVYAVCVPHPPLIIPEIGKGEEEGIRTTIQSYEDVMQKAASYHPDTVVVCSPHSTCYADYLHISPGDHAEGNFGLYRAGQVKVACDYDEEFANAMEEMAEARHIAAGTLGEQNERLDHGTMIPLYFLQKYTTDFKVVRIGISGLSYLTHYQMGKVIHDVAETLGRRVVFVASGDLSHKLKDDGPYGFNTNGPIFDLEVTSALGKGDFLTLLTLDHGFCEEAAECGLRSFQMMTGALDRRAVTPRLLSYEGPFGVGYGVADFVPGEADDSRDFDVQAMSAIRRKLEDIKAHEDVYVKLARHSVETYVRTGKKAEMPLGLPHIMFTKKAGVFVTLKKDGMLRGCIGTFLPAQENVAHEILENAISACSRDPRFARVTKQELSKIVYSVDVLGEVTPATVRELDPKKYGIIVSKGRKRGLLLPNLDGVGTVDEQIDICMDKAGIASRENISLQKFEVVRHT